MKPQGIAAFSTETKQLLRALQQKNNTINFFYILADWALIVGAIALSKFVGGWLTYLLAIAIIGSRQRAFDNLTHEASHNSLFKNQKLNNIMGSLFSAFPLFTSFTAYKDSHFIHHRHLSEEVDPDLIRYKLIGLDNPPSSGVTFTLKHILSPITMLHVPLYIYGTLRSFIYSKETPIPEQLARLGYWVAIVSTAVYFGHGLDIVLYWIVPYVTVLQVIRYFAEMSEHAGLMTNQNPLMKTRNVFGNRVFLKLVYPHHDHYHLIHHLFAGIPHYNLPKAHKILMKEPSYCEAKHCMGYFFSPIRGVNSVVDDIRNRGERSHVFAVNNKINSAV
ncbi:MAG: fatty acid desaturase family protein [Tumebacillaceae bacterium]